MHGTAMGTPMAPTNPANLTLGYLGKKVFSCTHVKVKDKYFRYIDDILIIWTPECGNYALFIDKMKNLNDNIRFTVQLSRKHIEFLVGYR